MWMEVTQNPIKWWALVFEVNYQKDSSFHHEDGHNEWLH
jgi:hypothetical protein